MKKPIALIIMDGYGESKFTEGNAIHFAKTPNLDKLMNEYPNSLIQASGMDVGLPEGQMGNSEVGHTNIGAGRIVYQDLTRITKSILDGEFFNNKELLNLMDNAKDKALHIMGLLSNGGVHSHIDHIKGFIKMAKDQGVQNVFVHAFTDGRDVAPSSAMKYVNELESYMAEVGVGKFASISGRYYAMDRDKRWDRVQLAYDAIVNGNGQTASSAKEAIENSYAKDQDDEFVLPTVIVENGEAIGTIKEGDSVGFANFRPDRAREITRAIVDHEFTGFDRPNMDTLFVCLTTYDVTIKEVKVAFKPQSLKNTLGEYLAKNGKVQLRTAETEKYAHVTFFFNGGVEEPNQNEDRLLVPSPDVATYDLQPEMNANELTEKVLGAIDEDKYDFIVLNFANPDMVGHTGVVEAAVKAVETVDTCVGKVVDKILEKGGISLITADHGNAELMICPETKTTITAHSTNPVPFIVTDKSVILKENGRLCDIAPTILKMMNLDKPEEMTGISLV
ncbi:MAG: 2,3-bisphosphoglycerate-independent phosphoglycerate mutase [Peptostreptococcaceae bacterium]